MPSPKAEHLVPLLAADVYEAAGRLLAVGGRIARAAGRTHAEWRVLSAASTQPPLTVPRIARRLGIARQSVQRTADRLVLSGEAEYVENRDHARSPLLRLTAGGQRSLRRIGEQAGEQHRRLAALLTDAETRHLHRGLRALCAALAQLDTRRR